MKKHKANQAKAAKPHKAPNKRMVAAAKSRAAPAVTTSIAEAPRHMPLPQFPFVFWPWQVMSWWMPKFRIGN